MAFFGRWNGFLHSACMKAMTRLCDSSRLCSAAVQSLGREAMGAHCCAQTRRSGSGVVGIEATVAPISAEDAKASEELLRSMQAKAERAEERKRNLAPLAPAPAAVTASEPEATPEPGEKSPDVARKPSAAKPAFPAPEEPAAAPPDAAPATAPATDGASLAKFKSSTDSSNVRRASIDSETGLQKTTSKVEIERRQMASAHSAMLGLMAGGKPVLDDSDDSEGDDMFEF
eukprot:TRINITY_DN24682_c0_g1_i2.p2 TRINITY_DN24682_c0_g1~~TRINITY_DN24682_c0_g1_i2.p2  ORF type:complete len:230 (-),score=55.39 TRINITY_DN24682_c0_g1_i2:128-817(-)